LAAGGGMVVFWECKCSINQSERKKEKKFQVGAIRKERFEVIKRL